MAIRETTHANPEVEDTLSLLQDIFDGYHPRCFAVRLWEGTTWAPEAGQPARFTLVLKHPGALRQIFWRPTELSLAEAFIYDDFDVEGQIEALFPVGNYLQGKRIRFLEKLRYSRRLLKLPSDCRDRTGRRPARLRGDRHSVARDHQAVIYHYDVSNAFYALWLDQRMVYSCAYFTSPDDDLDVAQERKLDYICRKLRLSAGDRLLDIGCGWGGLVIHAAQRYGVEALGITLSEPQAELANVRIARAGLADRCRVELCDYRNLDTSDAYDKLVSIGMVEHVGEAKLPEYFACAWKLLRPGGVFLNHGIANLSDAPVKTSPTFMGTYVFPDSELPSIHTVLEVAEACRFEVRDVESLREHYVLTLRHWVRRLEACREEAHQEVDAVTFRIWRLYMAGSAHAFAQGYIGVYQALLVKHDQGRSGLPLTRTDWYAPLA